MAGLPPLAPFPSMEWRMQIGADDWLMLLESWAALLANHVALPETEFSSFSVRDESVTTFLRSFMEEVARFDSLGASSAARTLLKKSFLLATKLLQHESTPVHLATWEFCADLARIYGKKCHGILANLSSSGHETLRTSLGGLKKVLVRNLDAGLQGDLKMTEQQLERVNPLVHAWPTAAVLFMAGSDFLDGLANCYRIMNPPLRKHIITTTYLCLMGLADRESPRLSELTDQLYSLKAAASAHKSGPLNANDSLVPALVTNTPLLLQVEKRLAISGSTSTRIKAVLTDLAEFRKHGGLVRPKRLVRRKMDKGKGVAGSTQDVDADMHVHRMSRIAQIQDVLPEIGSAFASRLLDEYADDAEQVIAHLLDDSLPPWLRDADRNEQLPNLDQTPLNAEAQAFKSQLPSRRNVFDNNEIDRAAFRTGKLHVGKRGADRTADDVLADRSTAPNKAAILSALASFESDDDERDDTYDAADVGGTVDTAYNGEDGLGANEEVLFRAWKATPGLFGRDRATRQSASRISLRDDTGMTDEAIEGWAIMLGRNVGQRRRLEARYGEWTGAQAELASTAWRADAGDNHEGSASVRAGRGSDGFRGRGRGRGRGGAGAVAGPSGDSDTEAARRRKEANKASSANHNRRDGRARKMARGGFPG